MLEIREYEETLLSHPLVPAGPIPTAYDPDGVYPYESFCETARRPVLRNVRMIAMENDRLRVVVCPDLGGRVHSLFLKDCGKEVLFVSPALRPVRILPRQCFIGGGIEVSFPISHSPVQMAAVLSQTAEENGRLYIWCGERELRFGMHWTVEYSLGERDEFLTQRTLFFNPTAIAHPWMAWANAGVPARPDTEFHFPGGPVLSHGDTVGVIDWAKDGPQRQSDVRRMTGYFWREPDCCAFGAFTPSLGCGLYHVADPVSTPGIKLWSDGVGPDEAWVSQWTIDGQQCLEIQAGPLRDQSIKALLQPGEQQSHVEFWWPTEQPLDIHKIPLPTPQLIPLERVPLFPWAREIEVAVWDQVIFAHQEKAQKKLPPAPDVTAGPCWAPSGIDDLGNALRWAAAVGSQKPAWLAQLGFWLAGREEIDAALEALLQSGNDPALALAGRLYRRCKNDAGASAECFRRIQSEVFALHPQVSVERDLTLTRLGSAAFAEREKWLGKSAALQDDGLIERRVALLVEQGNFTAAKILLEGHRFQLVHQRYARTRLWKTIQEGLSLPTDRPQRSLGEDDLAEFGAYREYQEDAAENCIGRMDRPREE